MFDHVGTDTKGRLASFMFCGSCAIQCISTICTTVQLSRAPRATTHMHGIMHPSTPAIDHKEGYQEVTRGSPINPAIVITILQRPINIALLHTIPQLLLLQCEENSIVREHYRD